MCARVLPAADAPTASAGGTKRTREPVSTHQSSTAKGKRPITEQPHEDPGKAQVLKMLIEIFEEEPFEEVSCSELEQRLQPRLPTEELIAVLEALDSDGHIMYRDGAAHNLDDNRFKPTGQR